MTIPLQTASAIVPAMTSLAAVESAPPYPLIGPEDPPVFTVINADAPRPVLLLADHASNALPQALNNLGLGPEPLGRHIAYDIGIAWMARRLSDLLGVPAILHGYSRLLIDPNRPLDDPTSICMISDGQVVPGNRSVGPEAAAERADAVFHPYHAAVEGLLGRMSGGDQVPAVVSLHSFTPSLKGFPRPWHVGVLWAEDDRIPVPLMDNLARDPGLCVGDNQPYSGKQRYGYSIETHALPQGRPNALIEVRQDLIDTPAKAEAWAARLAGALAPVLDASALYQRW